MPDKAIQLAPKFDNFYYNRSFARYDLGDKQGVLADLNQVIELHNTESKYADALYQRSFIRSELGNKQGAIKDSQQAANQWFKEADMKNYQKAIERLKLLQQ
jgi:tetratricopeptide (TPR) repeat protein